MFLRTLTALSLVLLTLLLPVIGTAATAETIIGKVVGVHDGDTLTLLDDAETQIKVRLAEIDAPESHQPYGSRAKQELSGLAFGRSAIVQMQDIDRYGRTVGRVTVDGVDVNAEMVRRGAAWVYRKYAKDQSLFTIEEQARDAKAGLWALPEADQMPPWEWRKMSKARTK
ncbi:MAG: thermonuclease family protein [Nitrospira sp.]|nr:thermonuclease family protein [Nitrospira sp.]